MSEGFSPCALHVSATTARATVEERRFNAASSNLKETGLQPSRRIR
jgi:hypothetical protein